MFARIKSTGFPRAMVALAGAMFSGDVVCQYIEANNNHVTEFKTLTLKKDIIVHNVGKQLKIGLFDQFDWNLSRSIRMGLTGFFVSGPLSQGTYVLTSSFLSNWSPLKRVMLICFTAPINISMTMAANFYQCGFSNKDIFVKLKRDVPTTWAINTIYWPGCLYFNLTRVPLVNQGAVGSVFWFVWSIALSLFCNLDLVLIIDDKTIVHTVNDDINDKEDV